MEEKEYKIPPEGSLGLLALGHIGLYAWRKSRDEYEKETGLSFESFYIAEIGNNQTALNKYIESTNEKS